MGLFLGGGSIHINKIEGETLIGDILRVYVNFKKVSILVKCSSIPHVFLFSSSAIHASYPILKLALSYLAFISPLSMRFPPNPLSLLFSIHFSTILSYHSSTYFLSTLAFTYSHITSLSQPHLDYHSCIHPLSPF